AAVSQSASKSLPCVKLRPVFGWVLWRAQFLLMQRGLETACHSSKLHRNNGPFERAGEDEIALVVTGRWTNYQVSFTWMKDIEALHLACAFDVRVPETRI